MSVDKNKRLRGEDADDHSTTKKACTDTAQSPISSIISVQVRDKSIRIDAIWQKLSECTRVSTDREHILQNGSSQLTISGLSLPLMRWFRIAMEEKDVSGGLIIPTCGEGDCISHWRTLASIKQPGTGEMDVSEDTILPLHDNPSIDTDDSQVDVIEESNDHDDEKECIQGVTAPKSTVRQGSHLCQHESGCATRACFGPPRSKLASFCRKHALAGFVDVKSKKCCHPSGCDRRPSFGPAGSKAASFCREHAPAEFVNVKDKRCSHTPVCDKIPHFGAPKSKIASFCKEHAPIGFVNVKHKKCSHSLGCDRQPAFGPAGSKVAFFCKEHAPAEFVDVKSKKCSHPSGCDRQPHYGPAGSKLASFCREHAPLEFVDVKNKKCSHPSGCDKIPHFGPQGSKVASFCREHAPGGFMNVKSKKCSHSTGCDRRPTFGPAESKVASFCREHAPTGFVDVNHKKCTHPSECKSRANFGPLFADQRHCARHREANEYAKRHPKCAHRGCKQRPTHTDQDNNYPIRCEEHRLKNDKDVIQRECKGCHLTWFIRDGLEYCNDCHDFRTKKPQKRQEMDIVNFLSTEGVKFKHDQTVDADCSRKRPDLQLEPESDAEDYVVCVEVDEDQHRTYACACEQARIFEIAQAYGGRRVVFIRYNPDGFRDKNGKSARVAQGTRKKRLINLIRSIRLHPPTKAFITIFYLFYDGDDGINRAVEPDFEQNRMTISMPEDD